MLVELLQLIKRDGFNLGSGSNIGVLGISNDANLQTGSADIGETVRAAETLILLGIVVLQANLQFNGLEEVSLVGGGTFQDSLNGGV